MKLLILIISFSALSMNSFAGNKTQSIQGIIDDFYTLKLLNLEGTKHDCYPQGQSCFKTACSSVGTFECDDQNEMNLIRKACRGVWGDTCLKTAFNYLHQFEYDDTDEMVTLVNSCRGVYDTDCISFTCKRLGTFGCDDIDEITAVNRACAGN
jgi:hypothetical protein